jgi:hypothetical protein
MSAGLGEMLKKKLKRLDEPLRKVAAGRPLRKTGNPVVGAVSAAHQSKEKNVSLTAVLARSRLAAAGKIAPEVTVAKSVVAARSNERVNEVNGMLASRSGSVQKVQRNDICAMEQIHAFFANRRS